MWDDPYGDKVWAAVGWTGLVVALLWFGIFMFNTGHAAGMF
jgi:hypothetical protein